jgi:hypothetical protein
MSLLRELAGHPEYMALLKKAEAMRPALPEWDRGADNVEEWKEKSAMRQGFDLALSLFQPR